MPAQLNRRRYEKQNVNKTYIDFKMASISLLPDEVLLDIFARLDTLDIINCGQVSKRFREISKDETIQKRILVTLLQTGQPIPQNLTLFFFIRD